MVFKANRKTIYFNSKMVGISVDLHKQSGRITALIEGEVASIGTLVKPNNETA